MAFSLQNSLTKAHVILVVLLIQLTLTTSQTIISSPINFEDVSISAGLQRPHGKRIKYGGASIADLNGDGYPDLIFGHHDERSAQLYFNNRDGTFSLSKSFSPFIDGHGYSAVRTAPWHRNLHFMASRGGQKGTVPNAPLYFSTLRNNEVSLFKDLDNLGLTPTGRGRGRSTLFLNLRRYVRYPDAILFNAPFKSFAADHHRLYSITGSNKFVYRNRSENLDFVTHINSYGTVTDIDNDGIVEVITYQNLRVFKRIRSFILNDITANTLSRKMDKRGSIGVAELDFDNDGKWDLYVARSRLGELKWLRNNLQNVNDRLLHNTGSKSYNDIASRSGIDQDFKSSAGITVGDFNNDGWIDMVVPLYEESYSYIYMNNKGDGTFTKYTILARDDGSAGDQVTAVDFNLDGKLDLVVSEGEWFDKSKGGFYKIYENIQLTSDLGNYLLVRVKSSPGRGCSSLHAVATVCVVGTEIGRADKSEGEQICMMRRVGSPGTVVSTSFIETLHFGVGNADVVKSVSVKWVDGKTEVLKDQRANRLITIGS